MTLKSWPQYECQLTYLFAPPFSTYNLETRFSFLATWDPEESLAVGTEIGGLLAGLNAGRDRKCQKGKDGENKSNLHLFVGGVGFGLNSVMRAKKGITN